MVNAPDCGSGTRGFDSHLPPFHIWYSQLVRQWTLTPYMLVRIQLPQYFVGYLWRYSQVVRQRSAKPLSPVQIRLPPFMPVWRNWQTRWTQNPVSVEDVSVRPRSPVFLEIVRNSKVREIGLFSL